MLKDNFMNWKKIDGYNYEISDSGIVRNFISKKIIKPSTGKNSEYFMVSCHIANGKRKMFIVHRLVAIHFILNPENKPQVNHIDKNKQNNCVSNLEWCTPKENMAHHYENGGVKRNNQTYKGKFGAEHNRSVKINFKGVDYSGYSEAHRATGVSISTIHYQIKRKNLT